MRASANPNRNPSKAEQLAKVLADAGIESDEVPQPRVKAFNAAQNAFDAIDAGGPSEWRAMMEDRRGNEGMRKRVDRKLAAICERALEYADLSEGDTLPTAFAFGYFSAKAE